MAIRARLRWLYTRGSALLGWVQNAARHIAEHQRKTLGRAGA
jgi:hypothetical protein